MSTYVVVAPCVVGPVGDIGNREFYYGAVLPAGIPEDRIKMWLNEGLIQQIKGDAKPVPPPLGGKGSGLAEWTAYAETLRVTVPADATRDDVVAAITEAGHPTE